MGGGNAEFSTIKDLKDDVRRIEPSGTPNLAPNQEITINTSKGFHFKLPYERLIKGSFVARVQIIICYIASPGAAQEVFTANEYFLRRRIENIFGTYTDTAIETRDMEDRGTSDFIIEPLRGIEMS